MNKKFKMLGALVSMSATLIMMTACGGGGTSSQNTSQSTSQTDTRVDFVVPPEGFDETKKVSITFYHTMGQSLQNVLDLFIEDFNLEYPNISVTSRSIGAYDDVRDQMTTQLSSGSAECDIAYCYPDHVAIYNQAKSVIALDNLIADETYGLTQEQQDDFVQAYYEEGRSFGDGKMYSLPFTKSSEVMYYDYTFFEKHNLTVPTTWDEMETVCAQIKAIDPLSVPLGYDSASNWFITMCEQMNSPYTSATGENFLFNNDTNKGFVKRFKSWFDAGYVTTKNINGSYTSGLFTSPEGQRCYMCIGSSAGATYQRAEMLDDEYRFETGIVPIPQYDENNTAVISQGPNICLFNSKDPQKIMASWLFAKFFTTNIAFQAQFSMVSGYTPILKSVFENEQYKAFLDKADMTTNIAALSTKVTVEQEDYYFTSPAFVGSSRARDEVGALLESIFGYRGDDLDGYIDQKFEQAIQTCKEVL